MSTVNKIMHVSYFYKLYLIIIYHYLNKLRYKRFKIELNILVCLAINVFFEKKRIFENCIQPCITRWFQYCYILIWSVYLIVGMSKMSDMLHCIMTAYQSILHNAGFI